MTTSRDLPLVTVLTPTYNRRDFLRSTLASVRAQTHPHIEHIVLDGGSTDGSVELLARAEERWGVRWVSGRDGGMYEALNKGLELASGSIVGWVNSDDWLLPWTVSTVERHMSDDPRPHAVFGDCVSVRYPASTGTFHIYSGFQRSALKAGKTLAQPTVFWPRSVTSDVGPLNTTTYRQIADCEYWLRLSKSLRFVKVREFMAVQQNHPDTKREALSDVLEREFGLLRAQYNHFPFPALVRRGNVLRERLEWLRLLRGQGWTQSRESELLSRSWDGHALAANLLRSGPWRRHPLEREHISVSALRALLEELESELA